MVVRLSMVVASFYSHVNYSVTKMAGGAAGQERTFYSHVNYSVTKIEVVTPMLP